MTQAEDQGFLAESTSNANQTNKDEVQVGVAKVEAISSVLTKVQWYFLYGSILAVAYIFGLDGQTNWSLTPAITSSFESHSSLGILSAIGLVVDAIVKVPIAKVANVIGRAESYALALVFYIVGYSLMCNATDFGSYAASFILYEIGGSGIYLMQQLIIADITSLSSRGFLSSLPDAWFYINNFVGPVFAQHFLPDNWRTAFIIFVILVPVTSAFVIGQLYFAQSKASKQGIVVRGSLNTKGFLGVVQEFDLGGILILIAAWFLILFPLNAYIDFEAGWGDPAIIGMLVGGIVLHILFFPYEIYIAKHPIIPFSMASNLTVLGGCLSVSFLFMSWYIYTTFFASYLFLTRGVEFTEALWISNAWSFSSVTSSIALGAIMKFHKRFLIWAWIGLIINFVGNGLMIEMRGPENSAFFVVLTQILAGVGAGFLTCATQVGVQAALGHQHVAIVTAVYLSVASFGGAIGSIIADTMWASLLPQALTSRGVSEENITVIMGSVFDARENFPEQLDLISASYTEASRYINIAAVCALIPVFLCLLMMKNLVLSDDKVANAEATSIKAKLPWGKKDTKVPTEDSA